MKAPLFLLASLFAGGFFSCGNPLPETCTAVFPQTPPLWKEILGDPSWRLEWYDSGGVLRYGEFYGAGEAEIGVLSRWPNPVLARPWWPEKDIPPGLFRPAGALYPFDASGKTLSLSWEAGAEAEFYRELEKALSQPGAAPGRVPRYFDWPRFRALLREEAPEPLREDPWLADWKDIAAKTAGSGFRKSLVKAESRKETALAVPRDGPWLGTSPFAVPVFWEKEGVISLPLSPRTEILVCPEGMLKLSPVARLWLPWDE